MLSQSYCSIWFFIYLLQRDSVVARFYLCGAIQRDKVDSIDRRYKIMVVIMLKNLSRRYSSRYIILNL